MRLQATKTSLYKLVAEHTKLPAMKYTEFWKAQRRPDYFLIWYDDNGVKLEAFFAACMGKPLLSIQAREHEREIERNVHTLSIQNLRERGMIDER